MLLNFSRDKLVNESDLLKALEDGRLAGYVTDFPNDSLVGKDKVILLPHLGASTAEAEDNCASMAVEQMMDFFENGNIRNSVNFPAVDMGPIEDKGRIALFVKAQAVERLLAAEEFSGIKILRSAGGVKGTYGYVLLETEADRISSTLFYGPDIIRSRGIRHLP